MTILPQPEKDVTDPLTELLRFGARELIAQAVETGLLDAHIGRFQAVGRFQQLVDRQAGLRSRERFRDIPVSKIDSIFDCHYGPGRPASVALRYAPRVSQHKTTPANGLMPRSDARFVSPLARFAHVG